MAKWKIFLSLVASSASVVALSLPSVAMAASSNSPANVSNMEQQAIQTYDAAHQATPAETSPSYALEQYISSMQQKLKSPHFQQYITQQWQHDHASQLSSGMVSNSTNPPLGQGQGSVEVLTSSQAQAGWTNDTSASATTMSIAQTIAMNVAGLFFKTLGNVVLDIASMVGSQINDSQPVSSQLWHTITWNYEDVYVWNGQQWLLEVVDQQQQWNEGSTSSWVVPGQTRAVVESKYLNQISNTIDGEYWGNYTMLAQIADGVYNTGGTQRDFLAF